MNLAWLLALPASAVVSCLVCSALPKHSGGDYRQVEDQTPLSGELRSRKEYAEQYQIAAGMVCAVAAGVLFVLCLAPVFFPLPAEVEEGLRAADTRVVFALKWQALVMLPLVMVTARLADLTTARRGAAEAVAQNAKYMLTTMEQVVIAVPAQLVLACYLPPKRMVYIPAMAGAFSFARVLAWQGMMVNPDNCALRSFAFALTFGPSAVALMVGVLMLVLENT